MDFETLTSSAGPGTKRRKRFSRSSNQSEEDENNYKRMLDLQEHLIRICETNFANIFSQLQQFERQIMNKVNTVSESAVVARDSTIFDIFPLKCAEDLTLLEIKIKDSEYCAKLTDIVQQLAGSKNFRRYFQDNVVSLCRTSSGFYKILENVWEDSNFSNTFYQYCCAARRRWTAHQSYQSKKRRRNQLSQKQKPLVDKTPIEPRSIKQVQKVNQPQVQRAPRFQLSTEHRRIPTQLTHSQQPLVQPTNALQPTIGQCTVPQPLTELPIEQSPVQTLPNHRPPFLRSMVQQSNHLSQAPQPSIQQTAIDKQLTTPVSKVFQPQVQRSPRFPSTVKIQPQPKPPKFIIQPSLSILKTNSPASVPCLPNPQCSISILPIALPPGSSPSIPKDPLS